MFTGPPAVTPVTMPLCETVAIDVLDDDHVTVRPVSAFPLASRGVAVSAVVRPTPTEAVVGATATLATDATAANVADTFWSRSIVIEHEVLLKQAPLHAEKVLPELGVAASDTAVRT